MERGKGDESCKNICELRWGMMLDSGEASFLGAMGCGTPLPVLFGRLEMKGSGVMRSIARKSRLTFATMMQIHPTT